MVNPLYISEMTRSALALAALSVAVASGFTWSCSRESSGTRTACARARVGGRTVCLRPSLPCSRRYERVYRKYGLTCRAAPGGYRLRERTYIAPPNP
jgi:hypothetical protein